MESGRMEDNLASAIEASGSSGVDRAHGTTRNDRDTQVAYHGIEGQKALPDFTVGGSAQIPIDLTADDDDLPIITETRSRPTKRKTLAFHASRKAPVAASSLIAHTVALEAQADGGKVAHLFTDGSFRKMHGGCAVAFQNVRGEWGGRAIALRGISDSTKAEMYGVLEAFTMVADGVIGAGITKLIVHTDNKSNVTRVREAQAGRCKEHSITADVVEQAARLTSHGIEVKRRRTEGHSLSTGNHVADRLASFGREKSEGGVAFKSRFDSRNPKSVAAVVRLEESRVAAAFKQAQKKQRRAEYLTL